jgi:hypothetical protein
MYDCRDSNVKCGSLPGSFQGWGTAAVTKQLSCDWHIANSQVYAGIRSRRCERRSTWASMAVVWTIENGITGSIQFHPLSLKVGNTNGQEHGFTSQAIERLQQNLTIGPCISNHGCPKVAGLVVLRIAKVRHLASPSPTEPPKCAPRARACRAPLRRETESVMSYSLC